MEDKMIQEMAKIICNTVNGKELKHCDIQCEIDCLGIARELLKHYQPKLPENAVVLDFDYFEQNYVNIDVFLLVKEELEYIKRRMAVKEKETAREILKAIKERFVATYLLPTGLDLPAKKVKYAKITEDDLNELAKQFGVEVE